MLWLRRLAAVLCLRCVAAVMWLRRLAAVGSDLILTSQSGAVSHACASLKWHTSIQLGLGRCFEAVDCTAFGRHDQTGFVSAEDRRRTQKRAIELLLPENFSIGKIQRIKPSIG